MRTGSSRADVVVTELQQPQQQRLTGVHYCTAAAAAAAAAYVQVVEICKTRARSRYIGMLGDSPLLLRPIATANVDSTTPRKTRRDFGISRVVVVHVLIFLFRRWSDSLVEPLLCVVIFFLLALKHNFAEGGVNQRKLAVYTFLQFGDRGNIATIDEVRVCVVD